MKIPLSTGFLDSVPGVKETKWATPLPKSLLYAVGFCCLLFLPSANPVLGIATLLAGLLIARMVWRVGEAQIPLYVCAYQWIQVMASTLQAELYSKSVEDFYGGLHFTKAVWLSLLGVTVFAIALGGVMRRMMPQTAGMISLMPAFYARLNLFPLLLVWGLLFVLNGVVGGVLGGVGLSQAWNPISSLRLGVALLLFQGVVTKNLGWWFLIVVVAVETAAGFLNYFSSFKTIYFVLLLAVATLLHYRKSLWIPLATVVIAVTALGLFWQVIKVDYRNFVSSGVKEQEISVSQTQQVNYLRASLDFINIDSLMAGAESVLQRLEYTKFCGLSIQQVPDNIPHSGGRLWAEAASSVVMPRIFFPNKLVFNDSDRTNEFCGIRVADASQGTSIGIGYVGESYIDFGFLGMFIPIGLLGMLVGWCYSKLLTADPDRLFGMASGAALLLSCPLFLESSNAKMLGSLVAGFLVLWSLMGIFRYLVPDVSLIFLSPPKPDVGMERRETI